MRNRKCGPWLNSWGTSAWPGAGNNGKGRCRLADACRLQGLPEDFLSDAPFTADGKLKAVANGVPIPMGRAIAKAILEAIKEISCERDQ